MFKGTVTSIFFFFIVTHLSYAGSGRFRLSIIKAYNGTLETHISGVSDSSPPYVRVIRSKDGLRHLFSSFNRIKNYKTFKKLRWLKRDLKLIDLKKYMLIAILSEPTDNYYMKFKGLYLINNDLIQVDLLYFHRGDISYQITPKKNIYYKILVVKKNPLPLVLNAEDGTLLGHDGKKKKRPVRYISGRLFAGNNDELRLVSSATRKGTIYYLKGKAIDKLKEHIGKRVALRGRVIDRHEGPYEANFEVFKLIRVY